MASFDIAILELLPIEGGYQTLTGDKGNYNSKNELIGTKYGISAKTLEHYLKRIPTVSDMKNLSLKTAKDIYYKLYWLPNNLGEITDQFITNHLFDIYVNMGSGAGSDILQDSINAIKPNTLTNDSITGMLTIGALNELIKKGFAEKINDEIYKYQVKKYISFGGQYLNSWLSRAEKYKTYIITTAKKNYLLIGSIIGIGLLLFLSKKKK